MRKTPHRPPLCGELGQTYDVKLVLCRKLHLFLGKSTKTAATRAALLTPICIKSFVGWCFAQTPLEELTALPQTP